MIVIETQDIPRIYKWLGDKIIKEGREVSPRANKTLELNDIIIKAKDPRVRLILLKNRRYNPVYPYVEFLHFFKGDDKPDMLQHYIKSLCHYINPKTGRFDGCYAPRLVNMIVYDPRAYPDAKPLTINQLRMVYERLKRDPDSRRAVLSIYNPLYDYDDNSKDIPCNDFLIFRIIDNKLNLTVISRSSDYYIGFIYDSFEFQLMQELVAGWLDVDVGEFIYHIASLHLYEKHIEKFKKIELYPYNLHMRQDARLNISTWRRTLEVLLLAELHYRHGKFKDFIVVNEYWRNMLLAIKAHNAFKYKKYDIAEEAAERITNEFVVPFTDFWRYKICLKH
ncbi:MAG: thymidylate synthase [Candidatus Odinarchaeia archaeon]